MLATTIFVGAGGGADGRIVCPSERRAAAG
jgi:hypothetical protein